MLDLYAPSEVPGMLALNPGEVVDKRVVLAIPDALTSLLRVDVDGHHPVDSVLLPDLEPGVAQRGRDHGNRGAWGDPGPPMPQPIEVEVIHEIGCESSR